MAQKHAELQLALNEGKVEIWPEHCRSTALFFAMGTQWDMAVGMAGVVYRGLKYEVLPIVEQRLPLDLQDPEPPSPQDVFEQLQTLEREALKHLNQSDN